MRSATTITSLPSKRPLKSDAKINWKIPRIHGTTGKTKYLRDKKINTELYPSFNAKLDKQFKYASRKNIPFVLVLGPDEAEKGVVTLKDLRSKKQKTLKLEEINIK